MFRLVYENRLSCLRSVCRFLYNSLKIGVASVLKKRRYGSLFESGTLINVPCMMWTAIFLIQVPGFRTFVVETFAAKCCVYSVLDPSFNLRDANTVRLFYSSVF